MQEKSQNKLIILGSGTSTGVPIITCSCPVCHSQDPKNKRMRMSVLIKTKMGKNILVDTGPEMRVQLLREKIKKLDAVIITHTHADHIFGMDDLRAFTFTRKTPLPIYATEETAKSLQKIFPYIFNPKANSHLGGKIALLKLMIIPPRGDFPILNENFYWDCLDHGNMKTLSFIHSKLAYLTDGSQISPSYLEKLKRAELDYLLIDSAAKKEHRTHMHLEKSIEYARKIRAKETGLIHLSHAHDHRELEVKLTQEVSELKIYPTYDGQRFYY